MASTKRRLVLCFDGTWNTPEDETNVSRIYMAIADREGDRQLKFYDAGVGTTWGSRIRGGAFGLGVNENILEGYCWLIDNYRPTPAGGQCIVEPASTAAGQTGEEEFEHGDEIFLFGFSRGAFTARSLAGLLNACGLLPKTTHAARTPVDTRAVQRAWKQYQKVPAGTDPRTDEGCRAFRKEHATCNVKVRFLGVWDTVGALGVPAFGGSALPRSYGFHNTDLCRIVEHAYQALAIDEHRRDYAAALWTQRDPIGTKSVEQRWFPGAHANIGGGYEDDLLPELSLKWMAEQACRLGLVFARPAAVANDSAPTPTSHPEAERCRNELREFQLDGSELLAPVRDSYKEFMFGLYQAGSILRSAAESAGKGVKGVWGALGFGNKDGADVATEVEGETGIDGRYYRPMLANGTGEVIDPSASAKWARDSRYRPRNLAAIGRAGATAEPVSAAADQANV
ncbi:MAG: DUF2235 domain-containing protein [Chromatiaceae bacterium]|nr:DUF2235 domain-containing protein [Chromatiaceae bacterium]